MGLFSKKDNNKQEKPKKASKDKQKKNQQPAHAVNPEDEIKRLDSNMGLELLYQGYMMVPQKKLPNGEATYLNVVAKHTPMFYSSESIAAYEKFAKNMKEQNGGTPDKVQCLELKTANHRDYGLVKTTFSDAVKILDSTESEGFLYLLEDGRGLPLTARMVRELSRRSSILKEQEFEREQQKQRDEYNQRVQAERSGYQQDQSYQQHQSYRQESFAQPTSTHHQPEPITMHAQSNPNIYQNSTQSQADARLKKNFRLMLDILSNVDAFNMWSAGEIYAIGYVMDKMYNSGDNGYYKATINRWGKMAREEIVKAKDLAMLISDEILRVLNADTNASETDINTARKKCEMIKQRPNTDMSMISFGIVPKHCVPVWCIEECNAYANSKKEEMRTRFEKICSDEGMNIQAIQKYYNLLSENHKLVLLELDYCLRTNKFKKYGTQILPDPKSGEMITVEEMFKRRNPSFQDNTQQFKKSMISGYIGAAEAKTKFNK